MIPWSDVATLQAGQADERLRACVAESQHTRLPVLGEQGVLGYVHQLDVLRAGPEAPVLDFLRPTLAVPPEAAVDRALARLRAGGQRMAIVGTLAQPLGLVTLKDLLEEISGDLAGW
jgi:CBS domain containing-hemolysin-like protein